MNWRIKAAIQRTISLLPWSGHLNYVLQRYISKGYPAPDNVFDKKIANSDKHLHAYRTFSRSTSPDDTFYEFGAGWDILVPLIYSSKGVRKQIIIDINDLLKMSLVQMNIDRLESKGFHLPANQVQSKADLSAKLNINFMAPHDARATGFATASVQFISNTDTLEHIPRKDIIAIVKECYRILAPGSVMSCVIDLRDHYAYFDPSISFYNFLTFSKDEWAPYDNDLHYQNRLRYSDYRQIFVESGFEIVFEDCEKPSSADIEVLKKLSLSQEFAQKDLNDIGVKEIWMVLRK